MIDQNAKPFAQYMILQNLAYHEERLINSKAKVDNKWRDLSLPLDKPMGSKKNYLNKEKFKEIENGNLRLLSRIYNIIFDKNKEFASKYNQNPKESQIKEKEKEPAYPNLSFHPFSNDNKIRTLNLQVRKKETDRINHDNVHLLRKLKDSKPTVFTIGEMKERQKNIKNLNSLTRKHTARTPSKVLPSITQRGHMNPVLENYLKRHDMLPGVKGIEDLDQDITAEIQKEISPARGGSTRNKSIEATSPKKDGLNSSLIQESGYQKGRPKMPRRKRDSNFTSDEVRVNRLNKSSVDAHKLLTSSDKIENNMTQSTKEGQNGQIKSNYVSDNAEKDIHSLQNSYIEDKNHQVNKTVL